MNKMKLGAAVLSRVRLAAIASAWAVTCVSAPAAPRAEGPATAQPATKKPFTTTEVLAASTPADWRQIDPQYTLYMDLPAGRVIIELAPQFAPHYVANVEALARQGYFNGLWVERVQDNYVAQWGDPDGKKAIGNAQHTIAAEFERSSRGLSFMPLAEPDTYAPEVGFSDGFPTAIDPKLGRAWLIHCNGMVGAGRDNDVDSGGGTELYAVIGQAPRHLDRNVTLLGKVVQGMELLSSLPRGTGPLGFYEKPEQRVSILSFKVASDVPESQRTLLEELRTDTQTFTDYIEARRNRHEEWFKVPAGHVDVCNVPIPVRPRGAAASPPR
jgi:peptidylprolyl isomerase